MADENNVHIVEWPKGPLDSRIALDMMSTREPVAVCIKLCEPICVKSEYVISIDIFDRPVSTITLRGKTTFYNCPEEL
ncbi:MAG: hypothetical protein ACXV8L_00965 [Ilumatobacteraceae bacterium]